MTRKFLTIHGHFYQPPRENPWLGKIEVEDSAAPYHDWNERINRESYSPNSMARILDADGKIRSIVNNFEKISFNIGPTLFAWLEKNDRKTYRKILEADKKSLDRFEGHGTAIAQCYNHMILPLANEEDKLTQIIWGIEDFKARFKRDPEGIWLPETAADLESLKLIADNKIKFTILAPNQAKYIKPFDTDQFVKVSSLDPTRPYKVKFEDGKSITIFFYDAFISQAIAFEKLLESGDKLYERIKGGYDNNRSWNQILTIATDGETFGHHHKFGEMALAVALDNISTNSDIKLTTFGEFLAHDQAKDEVIIYDKSSWSCAHGVDRWQDDCGCKIDPLRNYNQKWRKPLRESLNFLRDEINSVFDAKGNELFKDKNKTKNEYIDIVLDKKDKFDFLNEHLKQNPTDDDEYKLALSILEMKKNAMLMFTSCGWFFDDISGLEPVQILKYAAIAIEIAKKIVPDNDLETKFLKILETAKSNVEKYKNGKYIWETMVLSESISLEKIMANYMITKSLDVDIRYCESLYDIKITDSKEYIYSGNKLNIYISTIINKKTLDHANFISALLELGESDITFFIRKTNGETSIKSFANGIFNIWLKGSVISLIRELDIIFLKNGGNIYDMRDLFHDIRRLSLNHLAKEHIESFCKKSKDLLGEYRKVIDHFVDMNVPLPAEFKIAAEHILKENIIREASMLDEQFDTENILDLMNLIRLWEIDMDKTMIEAALEKKLLHTIDQIIAEQKPDTIDQFKLLIQSCKEFGYTIDLWEIQNRFFSQYCVNQNGKIVLINENQQLKDIAQLLGFAL